MGELALLVVLLRDLPFKKHPSDVAFNCHERVGGFAAERGPIFLADPTLLLSTVGSPGFAHQQAPGSGFRFHHQGLSYRLILVELFADGHLNLVFR